MYTKTPWRREIEFLGKQCERCGHADARVLKYSKRVPGAEPRIVGRSEWIEHVRANPEGYEIVCANCYWLKHQRPMKPIKPVPVESEYERAIREWLMVELATEGVMLADLAHKLSEQHLITVKTAYTEIQKARDKGIVVATAVGGIHNPKLISLPA